MLFLLPRTEVDLDAVHRAVFGKDMKDIETGPVREWYGKSPGSGIHEKGTEWRCCFRARGPRSRGGQDTGRHPHRA